VLLRHQPESEVAATMMQQGCACESVRIANEVRVLWSGTCVADW
jgi:hypothetical protein